MKFSDGQGQKIAPARAQLKDVAGLIPAHPSALNARTEAEVPGRFIGLTKCKTNIISFHRFSKVRTANHKVIPEDGKAPETGTQETLVNNKRYAGFCISCRQPGISR